MTIGPIAVTCKPNILVYIGQGTSRRAVDHTFASLREVAPHHCLVPATRHMLSTPHWHQDAALLVLPGGRDVAYLDALQGEPDASIRAFVRKGGGYLGICAGGYYAADRISFAKNLPEVRVEGERPLKFYPGLCQGPMTPTFDYDDFKGAKALPVWPDNFMAYYHGGGTFVDARHKPDVEVLHTYDAAGEQPASVACRHGEGLAVLTGLHLETSGLRLGDGYPPALQLALVDAEATRRAEFARLVQRGLSGDTACALPQARWSDGLEQRSGSRAGSLANGGHVVEVE